MTFELGLTLYFIIGLMAAIIYPVWLKSSAAEFEDDDLGVWMMLSLIGIVCFVAWPLITILVGVALLIRELAHYIQFKRKQRNS